MILVPTRVGPSRIHGLGLFTLEALPRNTALWRFEPGFDREFSPRQMAALPSVARAHLRWFAWLKRDTGGWVLSGDHACFMNHANPPNTGMPADGAPSGTTVSLRDLEAGEELTCDYWAFDGDAGDKLGPIDPPPQS